MKWIYPLRKQLLLTGIKEKHIDKWIERSAIDWICYLFDHEDYRIRSAILNRIASAGRREFDHLLVKGLQDREKPVFRAAVEAATQLGLQHEFSDLINARKKYWKVKAETLRRNWAKSKISAPNQLYINKEQMQQFKKLKELLAKQKGSMSIG